MADLSCNLSCFLLWHHFENKAVSGSVPNSVPKLPNEVTCRKFHHLAEPLAEVLKTMREQAAKFNVEKIKPQDLARTAGPPNEET